MVRFGIIIPNYNGIQFLPPCLDSILNQEFSDYEIILVDNASTDGSLEFVQIHYPEITIVKNSINRGYAGGCNDGVSYSSGEFLLMLNSDTILTPDCLSELERGIREYPAYGMYAPKILYQDGRINAAGSELSLSGSSWERGKGEPDHGQYDSSCEVFGPYGAAAVIRKDVFLETGGFDEDFFLFVEETDLSFRARLAGYSCRYVPRAVITHHHGGTVGRTSDSALYYLHRNSVWFVLKDYPLMLLLLALPFIIGRNIVVLLFYSMKGRGRIVFRAKFDAIRGLKMIIKKRNRIQIHKDWYHLNLHFIGNVKQLRDAILIK